MAFCLAYSGSLRAAEPFVTDDARILERGTCKVEVGQRRHSNGRTVWVLPACNLLFDVELQFAHLKSWRDDEPSDSSRAIEVKGTWRQVEQDGYGLGWVVNTEVGRHPAPGERRVREGGSALLATYPVVAERLTLHANLGTRYDRETRRGALTGGVLLEFAAHRRVALLAELYDTSRSRAGFQAGVRLTLVPDYLDLSLTRGGDEASLRGHRYWAMSLELTSPKPAR